MPKPNQNYTKHSAESVNHADTRNENSIEPHQLEHSHQDQIPSLIMSQLELLANTNCLTIRLKAIANSDNTMSKSLKELYTSIVDNLIFFINSKSSKEHVRKIDLIENYQFWPTSKRLKHIQDNRTSLIFELGDELCLCENEHEMIPFETDDKSTFDNILQYKCNDLAMLSGLMELVAGFLKDMTAKHPNVFLYNISLNKYSLSSPGNLYIKGLPKSQNVESLLPYFEKYGKILNFKIILSNETNRSLGYGFLNYQFGSQASECIKKLNGTLLNNSRLFINYHVERKERERLQISQIKEGNDDNKFRGVFIGNIPVFDKNSQKFLSPSNVVEKILEILIDKNSLPNIKIVSFYFPKDNSQTNIQYNNEIDEVLDNLETCVNQHEESPLKGYGFIKFKQHDQALAAIKVCNNFNWLGHKLVVNKAIQNKAPEFHLTEYQSPVHSRTLSVSSNINDFDSSANISQMGSPLTNSPPSTVFSALNTNKTSTRTSVDSSNHYMKHSDSVGKTSNGHHKDTQKRRFSVPYFVHQNGPIVPHQSMIPNFYPNNMVPPPPFGQFPPGPVPGAHTFTPGTPPVFSANGSPPLGNPFNLCSSPTMHPLFYNGTNQAPMSEGFSKSRKNSGDPKHHKKYKNPYFHGGQNAHYQAPGPLFYGYPIPTNNQQESNLYVKNLPLTWKDDDLSSFYQNYGEIISAKVITVGGSTRSSSDASETYKDSDKINDDDSLERLSPQNTRKFESVEESTSGLVEPHTSRDDEVANMQAQELEMGMSKGYGFVCFKNPLDASKAMFETNGMEVDKNTITENNKQSVISNVLQVSFAAKRHKSTSSSAFDIQCNQRPYKNNDQNYNSNNPANPYAPNSFNIKFMQALHEQQQALFCSPVYIPSPPLSQGMGNGYSQLLPPPPPPPPSLFQQNRYHRNSHPVMNNTGRQNPVQSPSPTMKFQPEIFTRPSSESRTMGFAPILDDRIQLPMNTTANQADNSI
ncbi:hypothetical protein ACO0RG_002245 [Hanseniaspora osmophila]